MGIDAAITLLLALIDQTAAISAAITKARAEGRTSLSKDEWRAITDRDDAAKVAQAAALARAEAEGR